MAADHAAPPPFFVERDRPRLLIEARRGRSGEIRAALAAFATAGDLSLLPVGPGRFHLVAPSGGDIDRAETGTLVGDLGRVVDLTGGLPVVVSEGPGTIAVLARLYPLDLAALPVGGVVGAVAHGISVLVHRAETGRFEIAVPASYLETVVTTLSRLFDDYTGVGA